MARAELHEQSVLHWTAQTELHGQSVLHWMAQAELHEQSVRAEADLCHGTPTTAHFQPPEFSQGA